MDTHPDQRLALVRGGGRPLRAAPREGDGSLRRPSDHRALARGVRGELLSPAPDDRAVALVRIELPAVRHLLRPDGAAGRPPGRGVVPPHPGADDGRGGDRQQRRRTRHAGDHRRPAGRDAVERGVHGHRDHVVRDRGGGDPDHPGGASRHRSAVTPRRCGRRRFDPACSGAPRSGPPPGGANPYVLRGARRDHPRDVHLQRDSPPRTRAPGERGHGQRRGAVRTRHPRDRRRLRQAPVRVAVGALHRAAGDDVEPARTGGVHRTPRRRRPTWGAGGRGASLRPVHGRFRGALHPGGAGVVRDASLRERHGAHEPGHGGLVRPGSAHRGRLLRRLRRLRHRLSHRLRPIRGGCRVPRIRAASNGAGPRGAAARRRRREPRVRSVSRRRRRTSWPGRRCDGPAGASGAHAGTG